MCWLCQAQKKASVEFAVAISNISFKESVNLYILLVSRVCANKHFDV